jgi:hypothetical protein
MHLIPIKFDRVFDIVQDPTGRGSYPTLFSFESAGKRYFSVSISGAPRLENGMEVIAALAHRDDWKSLEGWKDRKTGEIYLPKLSSVLTPIFRIAPLIVFCVAGYRQYDSSWFLAAAVLLSCLCLAPIVGIGRLRRARAALEKA